MKNFFASFILIIVVIALAFVACGEDKTDISGQTNTTASESQTETTTYQRFYAEKAENAEDVRDPLVSSFLSACRKAQQEKMKLNDMETYPEQKDYTNLKAVDDFLVIDGFATQYEVLLQDEITGEYYFDGWYTGDTLTPAIVAASMSNENIEEQAIVKVGGRYSYDYSKTTNYEEWLLADETPWCDFEITNEGWYHNTISHRFFEDDSTIFRTKPVAGFKFDPKFKCIVFTGELFFGETCIGLKK